MNLAVVITFYYMNINRVSFEYELVGVVNVVWMTERDLFKDLIEIQRGHFENELS